MAVLLTRHRQEIQQLKPLAFLRYPVGPLGIMSKGVKEKFGMESFVDVFTLFFREEQTE